MNRKLRLQRDIANILWMMSGAAAVTHGYWMLAILLPALAFQIWVDRKVDRLIKTAMDLALLSAAHLSEEAARKLLDLLEKREDGAQNDKQEILDRQDV